MRRNNQALSHLLPIILCVAFFSGLFPSAVWASKETQPLAGSTHYLLLSEEDGTPLDPSVAIEKFHFALKGFKNPEAEGPFNESDYVYRSTEFEIRKDNQPFLSVNAPAWNSTVNFGEASRYAGQHVYSVYYRLHYGIHGESTGLTTNWQAAQLNVNGEIKGFYFIAGQLNEPPAPTKPENLTTAPGDNSVVLTWKAVTGTGTVTYAVYQHQGDSAPNDWEEPIVTSVTEATYTVTGLTNGETYWFAVKAVNETGVSDFSDAVWAVPYSGTTPTVPDPEPPKWPGGSELIVSDITRTSVKLTWPPAIDYVGVSGYRIYVDRNEVQSVTASVYEYTVPDLAAGTTYTFTVRAFNAAGKESAPLRKESTTTRSSGGSGGGGSSGGDSRTLSGNADLAKLQVWANGKMFNLSPSFTSGTTDYTARTEAEQVEIVVKSVHFAAKVMLNEQAFPDRIKVDLEEGENRLVLSVKAENDTKKIYMLTIYRETPTQSEATVKFTDIVGHWAESYIEHATAIGIANGYPEGTFKPNHSVTRAEFTIMLVSALKLEGAGATLFFTDQNQIGGWAKQAVAQAVQAGIVGGYEDGSFRPNIHITRAEMAIMIARAFKLQLNANVPSGFADDEAIPQWVKGAVGAIRELGIVDGRGGNRFVPNDTATRAEAVVMLLRMLEHRFYHII